MEDEGRRVIGARMFCASRRLAAGKYGKALVLCDAVLRMRPWHPAARALRIRISFHGRACRLVVSLLESIADAGRPNPSLLLKLGAAYQGLEEYDCALPWLCRAHELRPGDRRAARVLARCLLNLGRAEEAIAVLRPAAEPDPNNPECWDAVGVACLGCGRIRDAKESFARALSLAPDGSPYLLHMVEALIADNNDSAVEYAERLSALEPRSAYVHRLLARAKLQIGLDEEAESICRKAVDLSPLDGTNVAQLASVCLTRAKTAEALNLCEEAIRLNPDQGLPYFERLTTLKTGEEDRAFVEQAATLREDPGLETVDRELLGYGLGKAFEDLGDYERAFNYYQGANVDAYRRKFGARDVDLGAVAAETLRFRDVGCLGGLALEVEGTDMTPIFVLGMIRSGTTLVEQILSCHPEVGGAGEQRYWNRNADRALCPGAATIDVEVLNELAREYCRKLSELHPDKRYVVDKMPGNYRMIGLIRQALPTARIIHVRRNPVDTCLSIFATQNNARVVWLHSKVNITFSYRLYVDVMDHWRRTLPPNSFMEVCYEELVAKPEPVIRRMLSYCGLAWFEGCLHPESNMRAVLTPSVKQVRRPIYKSSVERWRRFEPWIGEFVELNASTNAGNCGR